MFPHTLLDRKEFVSLFILILALSFTVNCQSDDSVKKAGLKLEHKFFQAIDEGNLATVEECLSEGFAIDKKDSLGNSGLIHAVDHENQKLVKLLIDKGANVNLRNLVGETALYRSVFRGNLALVKYLIQNGAESKIKNVEGTSPAVLAEERGEEDIQHYLEKLKK